MKTIHFLASLLALALSAAHPVAMADDITPFGDAKVDMHKYPKINRVYDVSYDDPKKLNALLNYINNVNRVVPGKAVVVLHGAEIRAFAKENYEKYQGVIDQLAELSRQGVDFRMCNNAMRNAGFEASDIDGFVTIVPAGLAEIISLQHKGYKVIDTAASPVKDSRYLDHPEKKPKS